MNNKNLWALVSLIVFVAAMIGMMSFLYDMALMDKNYQRGLIVLGLLSAFPLVAQQIKISVKAIGLGVVILFACVVFGFKTDIQTQAYKEAINDKQSNYKLWEVMYEKNVPLTDEAIEYIAHHASPEQRKFVQDLYYANQSKTAYFKQQREIKLKKFEE